MHATLTPRLLELRAAAAAALAELDAELWAVLRALTKDEYPAATRILLYARHSDGGVEIENVDVGGSLLAPENWSSRPYTADPEPGYALDAFGERMNALTSEMTGPSAEHPGEERWYQL